MIRLGIIGTGRIAKRAVKEIAEVQGLSVTSVYNPNYEHANSFADENGISKAFSNLDGIYDQTDALYIASPHSTHFEYAKHALMNGKHVLCEKPMTLNENECRELFELAKSNGLVLMEGIKTAYCPGFKKISEIVESGVIGNIVDVEAAFTRLTAPGCREFDDIKHGGSFTEFGTYTMLPIFRFLGTDYRNVIVKSVPAQKSRDSEAKADGATVDGYTKIIFDYGNEFGTAKTGLTVKSEGQLLISGTEGYILVPSPWWLTKHIEVRYEDPSKVDVYDCEFLGDGLRYEFNEFKERINKKVSDGNEIKREMAEAVSRAKIFEDFLGNR